MCQSGDDTAMRKHRIRAAALVAAGLLMPSALWHSALGGNGAPASAGPGCDRAAFRVIVDVGHTAEVAGAKSARAVPEYEFNLRLAGQVAQALLDAGFARTTLLITSEAPRRGLFQRAERANSLPADLFIAIHHDSVPNEFLETWEFEGEEFRFSDRFKGHSIFVSHDNGDRRGSLQFGRLLGRALKARGLQFTPHYAEPFMGSRQRELLDADAGVYRYDQLVVLKYTRMPAVLFEAGSIINRDEELELRLPERRALISEAMIDAVAAFCAQRARVVARHARTRAAWRRATAHGSNR
jgi:N-acetylmuramoyl-L-alanine amidase